MSKMTRERRAKRTRRIERRNLRIAETRAELKRNVPKIVQAIYAARPLGMKAWNSFQGEQNGRYAVVCYANESLPFDRILHDLEFPNAKLRAVIVESKELDGIPIHIPTGVDSALLPRVLFYSEGSATSIDVAPSDYQLQGVILD